MKILTFLILVSTFSSFAGSAEKAWTKYLSTNFFNDEDNRSEFPSFELLSIWRTNHDVIISEDVLVPNRIQKLLINCPSQELFSLHPYQDTKEYLYAVWAGYDHSKLSPKSYACVKTDLRNKHCLRATSANVMVVSDTFADACGNSYRGYWALTFLQIDENMGTLVSKGRTFYPSSTGTFGEIEFGDTYPTSGEEFLFLGPLLESDSHKIPLLQKRAFKDGYTLQNNLFLK